MTSHTYRGITFTVNEDRHTLQHYINLLDMAYFIQNSPPPEFDMSDYAVLDSGARTYLETAFDFYGVTPGPNKLRNLNESNNICGTSCCAIGTAAFHGVGGFDLDGMTWDDYSYEAFGFASFAATWDFLFNLVWARIDNTPEGAVARILSYVDGFKTVDVLDFYRPELYAKYLGIKLS